MSDENRVWSLSSSAIDRLARKLVGTSAHSFSNGEVVDALKIMSLERDESGNVSVELARADGAESTKPAEAESTKPAEAESTKPAEAESTKPAEVRARPSETITETGLAIMEALTYSTVSSTLALITGFLASEGRFGPVLNAAFEYQSTSASILAVAFSTWGLYRFAREFRK